MLAKKTSKNQLTLPKKIADQFPGVTYFGVRTEGDHIVLDPHRSDRQYAVRARIAARAGLPKFRLATDEIETLLGNYLPYADVIDTTKTRAGGLPVCRDPDDQKFLVLAHVGKADVLVTGDRALLLLAG